MVVVKRPSGAEPTPAAALSAGRLATCCCTSRSSGPSVRRVRDMLGDCGQEVGGGEDLEVAVDLGIEAGAVDDDCPLNTLNNANRGRQIHQNGPSPGRLRWDHYQIGPISVV